MTSEDIARAFEIFDRARAAAPEERDSILDGDTSLSADVREYARTLLVHDSPTGEFLGRSLAHTTADLASLVTRPPEQIGPYPIVRLLGIGGFGSVFLARDPRTRRDIAIKLMRPAFTPAEFRRMEFEAEALGRLNHEGIARVYACGIDENLGGSLYIAMEYVDGAPILQHAPGLGRREKIELLIRLCNTIAYAHQNGILHRDLSPLNILVDGSGVPKVLDFGLASTTERDAGRSLLLTAPGNVMGTLRSMSPEHLSGDSRAIDARSDTFSLGLIAFEVLTGRHPYISSFSTAGAAIHQILNAPLLRPSSLEPDLRGDLDAVLAKSVEREPARRYQTPGAFADDLQRALERRPVAARPAGIFYLARTFALRNRAAAIMISVALAVCTAAALYSAVALGREFEAQNAAITALDAVVSRVLTPLAPRIGTLEVREELLESIQLEVEQIAQRLPNDERVLRIRARFLTAASGVRRERARHREAYPLQADALRVYERLWATGERSAELGHEYSIAIVKFGDLDKVIRGENEGFASYKRALALDNELAGAHPSHLPILSNQFWSFTRFEQLAVDRSTGEDAMWRTRARATADRMLELDPRAWRSLEAAAFIESRFALSESDPIGALRHAVAAIGHAKELAMLDPSIGHHQGLLMLHCFAGVDFAIKVRQFDIAASTLETADSAARFLAGDADDPYVERAYFRELYKAHASLARSTGDTRGVLEWTGKLIAGLDWQMAKGFGGREELLIKGDQLTTLCIYLRSFGSSEQLQDSSRALRAVVETSRLVHPDDAEFAQHLAVWQDQVSQ